VESRVGALSDVLDLLDWKRRVFALYERVRRAGDPDAAWELWRRERDALFASHPQSPLPAADRGAFEGLPYFPYDAGLRVEADVVAAEPRPTRIESSGAAPIAFERVAHARFALAGAEESLELYWLQGYGGGLFLPFGDATGGTETYGGGRYLLDTVKGADLGMAGERLVLDFNFAYNPSCCYDPRWVCPLSPPANRLRGAIRAGEQAPAPTR
jgi:uncharacterized protein (DUF1684 family)